MGFVLGGTATRHVLVRAIGPTLEAFGVPDALSRPSLRLYRGSEVLASNDHWSKADARQLSGVFARTGAFLLPASSRDAALVFPLAPGAYTLEATGLGGGIGTVLIEAYGVP